MISKFIGWIGFSLGMFISVPQVMKSIRMHSTQGVSKLTYILLFFACICYAVRAMAIKEMIFIVSNTFQIIVAGTMLYLMRKYKKTTYKEYKSDTNAQVVYTISKTPGNQIMCDHLGWPNPEDPCPCGFHKGIKNPESYGIMKVKKFGENLDAKS